MGVGQTYGNNRASAVGDGDRLVGARGRVAVSVDGEGGRSSTDSDEDVDCGGDDRSDGGVGRYDNAGGGRRRRRRRGRENQRAGPARPAG